MIRVDCSRFIGIGHISRQIDIAHELKKKGFKVIFIMKDFPHASTYMENYDYHLIKLSIRDLSLNESIEEIKTVLDKINKQIDIFIIDLLEFFDNQEYLNILKEYCIKLIIITDHTSPFYVNADKVFVLSQNQKQYDYKNVLDTKYYTGLRYFPLSQQFSIQRNRKIRRKVKNIIITFGGTDSVNYSTRLATFLKNFHFAGEITFIIGPNFADNYYQEFQNNVPKNIIIKRNVKKMLSFFQKTDLCICSAGNTLIELLTCGVPCIVLPQTIREEQHALKFEKKGLIKNLGLNWSNDNLSFALKELLNNYDKRKSMSVNSQKYLDGQGLKRMIDIILEE